VRGLRDVCVEGCAMRNASCRVWLAALAMAGIGTVQAETQTAGSLLGSIPLSFEPNRGQSDPRVKFLARVSGYTLFVTANETVFAGRDGSVERMKLAGASRRMRVEPLDLQTGVSNYFLGNDPAKWRTDVPNYGRVALRDVYPGIDLIFYGNQRQLEYDWVVRPGADPRKIRVRWESAGEIGQTPAGDMVLGASLRQKKPVISQDGKPIEGGYVVRGREVGFQIAKYDTSKLLVIDPVIEYTSYLGGYGFNTGSAVTTDSAGNIYVAGYTVAYNFPGTPSFGQEPHSKQAAFVTKFAPISGGTTELLFTIFLGDTSSTGLAGAFALALDSAGNIIVAGSTSDPNFPTLNAVQSQYTGTQSCESADGSTVFSCAISFLTKLGPSGNALIFSTYYGGALASQFNAVAVDSTDAIYVAGEANGPSNLVGTATSIQPNMGSPADIQVVTFSPTGQVIYSTYLGGSTGQSAYTITVEKPGVVWIGAATSSSNMPTTSNAFQTVYTGLQKSAYIARIDTTQSGKAGLTYATFYNGAGGGNSTVNDIFLDPSGQVVFCGAAFSNLPTTATAMQPTEPGALQSEASASLVDADGFIARINPAIAGANGLTYGSFIGGSDLDVAQSCGLDPKGNFVVTGSTQSLYPFVTAGSPIPLKTIGSNFNVFVIRIDPNTAGGRLESVLFGGENYDESLAMAIDSKGFAYITGLTDSAYFPVTTGAVQKTYGGNNTAFSNAACCGSAWVMQLNLNLYQVPVAELILSSGDSQAGAAGSKLAAPLVVQLADANGNPLELEGYEISFTATGGVTLTSSSTELTEGAGTAGVFVQLGSTSGTVTATVIGTNDAYTFHVFVGSAPSPHAVSIVSGNNQSGAANTALAQPLVVQLLDANNNALPLAGVSVGFTPTNASVPAATVQTNANGQASTVVTLGSQTGSASVQATVSGVTPVTANFTVTGAGSGTKAPTIGAVVNGASFAAGGIVPGEIATLFGSNLTSSTGINLTSGLPLLTTFLDVSVMVNGKAAPLFAVDNVNGQQQINFQVPWEVASGPTANIFVTNNGTPSATLSVPVLVAQPGIINYAAAGGNFGVILHANFQLADTAHPAVAGETLLIYCTGLGAVTSPPPDGAAANGQSTVTKATVTIGGANAAVSFSGLAPGFVGLYQVNAVVPVGLASGNQPVVITMGRSSSNSVLLAVQ
jgi:uncharacterized protein (TIGR03437 family)